jgi:hypothetical protein
MNQRMPYVTEDERRAYGDDLLSVVERQAMSAFTPHLRRLEGENEHLRRKVAANEARDIYSILETEIGKDWTSINTSPEFLAWLDTPDQYSGGLRSNLLRQAFSVGDAARVVAFFRGFLNETGYRASSGSSAPRSTRGQNKSFSSSGAPEWTTSQIENFYEKVRQGAFAGKEQEKDRIEQSIFAASNAGRVRRG